MFPRQTQQEKEQNKKKDQKKKKKRPKKIGPPFWGVLKAFWSLGGFGCVEGFLEFRGFWGGLGLLGFRGFGVFEGFLEFRGLWVF